LSHLNGGKQRSITQFAVKLGMGLGRRCITKGIFCLPDRGRATRRVQEPSDDILTLPLTLALRLGLKPVAEKEYMRWIRNLLSHNCLRSDEMSVVIVLGIGQLRESI
jgi:hypothetical protein